MSTQVKANQRNQLYTLAEFESLVLPNDGFKYELIDGEIVMTPPAGDRHGRISDKIAKYIHLSDPQDEVGRVWQATRFKIMAGFGPAPDLAYMVAGRVPPTDDGAVNGVPDLVVEVWSPHDLDTKKRKEEALKKIRNYQTAGVRLIWAINPSNQTIEVYNPNQVLPVKILGLADKLEAPDIIAGLAIPLTELFK